MTTTTVDKLIGSTAAGPQTGGSTFDVQGGSGTPWDVTTLYLNYQGIDTVWLQTPLQKQMAKLTDDIGLIMKNTNLSDTEKMFSLQMLSNTYSSLATFRTNVVKMVSDNLKAVGRNIA